MSETYVPPHVISVLKTYQDTAPKSLHGPGLSLVHPSKAGSIVVRSDTPEHHVASVASAAHNHMHHASGGGGGGGSSHYGGRGGGGAVGTDEEQQQPQRLTTIVPPVPIMTTPDPDCGIVQMTVLEGKRIGCFLLGGEMRLCLPQIFNHILEKFSLEQINVSIQELMIYLYNCTDQQLQEFKRARIIPDTAKTCGLITRTNAERLCSALLHKPLELRTRAALKLGGSGGHSAFRVYHRCFGKCEGIFTPELYGGEEPACVECCKCSGMFTPQEFVCHQHEPQEIRTCHWGFNSGNWALYIHVDEGEKNRDEHAQLLKKIWTRELEYEQEQECEQELWNARQKGAREDNGMLAIKAEPQDIPLKKPKLMSDGSSLYHSSSRQLQAQQHHLVAAQQQLLHHHQQQQLQAREQQLLAREQQLQQQTSAAFRPWTAQQKKYAQQQQQQQQQQLQREQQQQHQQQQLMLQQMGPYATGGSTTSIVNGTVRATSPGGSILSLSQEPPLLQNPENVVPMSETDKFERSYQPNVALVPRKSILCGKEHSSSTSPSSAAMGGRREHERSAERSVIKCELVQIKQESPPTPPAASAHDQSSVVRSAVIKCDMPIKLERPGTPLSAHHEHDEDRHHTPSPGPPGVVVAQVPVSPPSPATPGSGSQHMHHHHHQRQGAIAYSTIITKQQKQPQQQVLVSSMAIAAPQYGGNSGGSNSNSPMTLPPDVQQHHSSGSNEITSSTSPLPPPMVMGMNGGCISGAGSVPDKSKLVLIKEPISPPPMRPGSNNTSGRHTPHSHAVLLQQARQQEHQGQLVAGHQPISPPPPPHHHQIGDHHHHQPLYLHHHHHHVLHHHRSHHSGTPTSGASGGAVGPGTIIHKNGVPMVGNSEFELSTDTDDDSQTGEPDSSNAPSTIELIGEVLKEVEPETKQQIMDIFKGLLRESRLEHQRLLMELGVKEDQLVEIQRQKDHLQQQVHQLQHELDRALLKIDSFREHHLQQQQQQQQQLQQQQQHHHSMLIRGGGAGESSTSSTPPSPLSLVSNGSNSSMGSQSHQQQHQQLNERRNSFPEKSVAITKPPKKMRRHSPDDSPTVLMLASPPPVPAHAHSQSPSTVVGLPSTLPACLSITATSVTVASKASHLPDQEAHGASARDEMRAQISVTPVPLSPSTQQAHHRKALSTSLSHSTAFSSLSSFSSSSPSPPGQQLGGAALQSPFPPPPPPPPQPSSATNVPASPTTFAATHSAIVDLKTAPGASTEENPSAICLVRAKSNVTSKSPSNNTTPAPIVVIVPGGASSASPSRPASRSRTSCVTPPGNTCRGDFNGAEREPDDDDENGEDYGDERDDAEEEEEEEDDDENHRHEESRQRVVRTSNGSSAVSPGGSVLSAKAPINCRKPGGGGVDGVGSRASTSPGASSNQENDSPNRAKGGGSGGSNSSSSSNGSSTDSN